MLVKIEYKIDDVMAWHCIEHLLNSNQRISRAKIVATCKNHLRNNGQRFVEQLEFDSDFPETRQVDSDLVDRYFEKKWLLTCALS